jgi:hypothetical protein
MRKCVRGDPVEHNYQSLYDLRHFYVDEKGIGRFTCGIAFETMMSILRMFDDAPFRHVSWYHAVSRSDNPVVQGFLAEQICLSHIARNGLTAINQKLSRMSTTSFSICPDFGEFLSSGHTTRLYVPIPYNFMAVDGVILLLDRKSKQVTMFSIQFTLSQNYKQSYTQFLTELLPAWSKKIILAASAGFTVQSTIVWIDKKQPSKHVKCEQVKALRFNNMDIYPEHSVIHVGVESVDSSLASALGIKQ